MARQKEQSFEMLLKGKRLPILTLDSRWHQLFTEVTKTAFVEELEEELNDLLKEQGRINTELKDLAKLKRNLMQEVMNNMEETIESKEAFRQKKLEKIRDVIKEINGKIDDLEEEHEGLPRRIRDTNAELMEASMEICYEKLSENEEELKELNAWINGIRKELKKKVVIKQEKEEVNAKMYSYMHDVIGPGFMEYFDKKYGR